MYHRTKNLTVSVIILHLNQFRLTVSCVDSLLASTYKHIEVILLDNASRDNSYMSLQKRYRNNHIVRVIRSKKQLYFTGGSNYAVRHATGDIVFFLNNDTVVDATCISHLVDKMAGNDHAIMQPKIVWRHNPRIIDNVGGTYSWLGFGHAVGRDEQDNGQYNTPTVYDYVNGTALMIYRDFFQELEGFDESFRYFYEDVDLCLRARKKGGVCLSAPDAIVYHEGSVTFTREHLQRALLRQIRKNRIAVSDKHGTPLQQMIIKSMNTILSLYDHFFRY